MSGLAKRLLVGLCSCALLLAVPASADYETDEPVDFALQQLGGGTVSLSDYRGQWVVVNYWATWCAPCRKEMPELSDLHSERPDVTVLGLAYEDIEDADFDRFLEASPVTYPILKVDVYEPPQPFGAPRVLPTTIILDRAGRAVKSFLGPVTRESIEKFLEAGAD